MIPADLIMPISLYQNLAVTTDTKERWNFNTQNVNTLNLCHGRLNLTERTPSNYALAVC